MKELKDALLKGFSSTVKESSLKTENAEKFLKERISGTTKEAQVPNLKALLKGLTDKTKSFFRRPMVNEMGTKVIDPGGKAWRMQRALRGFDAPRKGMTELESPASPLLNRTPSPEGVSDPGVINRIAKGMGDQGPEESILKNPYVAGGTGAAGGYLGGYYSSPDPI